MLVRPRAIGRPRLSLRARGEWSRKGEQAVPNRQPFGVSYFVHQAALMIWNERRKRELPLLGDSASNLFRDRFAIFGR